MEHEPTSLLGEATRLRLDHLAVQASLCLKEARVQHILLKGPTTARWLYDGPRLYRDVDLLVRPSSAQAATVALTRSGIASALAGTLGEEAHHSQLLRTPQGFELDLHVALPSTPVPKRADELAYWAALERHIQPFRLLDHDLPALDLAGRCLVVALHALAARPDSQALQDLHRARDVLDDDLWRAALSFAAELGVSRQARAALAFVDAGDDIAGLPLEFRLLAKGAPGAYQLRRLAKAPLSDLPRQLVGELFPSKGFMLRRYPGATTRRRLLLAHADRLRLILTSLPRQLLLLLREALRR